MSVGDEIRQARIRSGLTQDELARGSGVRQPNIAAYENGKRVPSAQMLARLLAAASPRPSRVLAERREEVLLAARRNHASNVRVFGSVARGDDRADSDIDLLVTFDESASLFDQAGLIGDLEAILGRHVDVVSERGLRSRDNAIRVEAVPL
jgi:predicted nucleotidyltransferase